MPSIDKTVVASYSDTALSTYALRLEKAIRGTFPLFEEINLCKAKYEVVKVAYYGIRGEIESILQKIEDIPIVIVGRDASVRIKDSGLLHRERKEGVTLTPLDGGERVSLRGEYRMRIGIIQIIVIARDSETASQIALRILDFNSKFPRTKFDVLFQHKGNKHNLKDFANFQLKDTRESEFSESEGREKALVILATEYQYEEQRILLHGTEYQEIKEVSINDNRVC